MSAVGYEFQQQTKYKPDRPSAGLRPDLRPELYKTYPGSTKLALPAFTLAGPMALDETLRRRRSVREFQPKALSLGQLAYLLWASAGIQRVERGYEFRTAPSAGALYPIETYLVVNRIAKLEPGAYHYGIRGHELEQIAAGDLGSRLAAAALGQEMCAAAAVVFIWSALFARSTWKYGQRAYRYIYLDAGHIAENLALAAVSLGLGTCQVGALFDDEINALLGLDGIEESVVYMSVVGLPV